MKTKRFRRIRRIFSNVINIRFWLDWNRIKAFILYIENSVKILVMPISTAKSGSFKHAVETYKITDAELIVKQKALFRLSLLMLVIAFFICIYMGYLFYNGAMRAGIVSLVVMGIAIVLAFRYHFWYFQIKKRKLGCTFNEWFRALRGGEK